MILSDRDIGAALHSGDHALIQPFDSTAVQPASYDVRLANDFRVLVTDEITHIDPLNTDRVPYQCVVADKTFILHPGQCVLASTVERFHLPNDLVARVEGKSSLARIGIWAAG